MSQICSQQQQKASEEAKEKKYISEDEIHVVIEKILLEEKQRKRMRRRPFLERYIDYTSNLAFADKVVKVACYGIGTIAGGAWLLNIGDDGIRSGLHTVGSEIGKTRMVYRTFELQDSYQAIKQRFGAGKEWKDKRIHKLTQVVNWCNILYITTEHLAWAHSRAPNFVKLPFGPDKWWAFSGFWWMACCIFQIWMDLLKMKELKRKELILQYALRACPKENSVLEALVNISRQRRKVKFSLMRFAFFLPNAYHWSLEHGCFSRGFACVLGLAEAVTGILATFPEC